MGQNHLVYVALTAAECTALLNAGEHAATAELGWGRHQSAALTRAMDKVRPVRDALVQRRRA